MVRELHVYGPEVPLRGRSESDLSESDRSKSGIQHRGFGRASWPRRRGWQKRSSGRRSWQSSAASVPESTTARWDTCRGAHT